MALKKIRVTPFIIPIILSILVFCWYKNSTIVNNSICNLLENPILKVLIFTLVIGLHISYFFLSKDKEYNARPFITTQFPIFFDIVIGGFTYAIGITSCVTLLSGIFIQNSFPEKIYYQNFNSIDLYLMSGTVGYFLYYLLMNVVKIINEILWVKDMKEINWITCITSFSTRPRFHCGIWEVIGFGKKSEVSN